MCWKSRVWGLDQTFGLYDSPENSTGSYNKLDVNWRSCFPTVLSTLYNNGSEEQSSNTRVHTHTYTHTLSPHAQDSSNVLFNVSLNIEISKNQVTLRK